MKNDGAIHFEPMKNSNIFKDFYSDLVEKRCQLHLTNWNNNSTKQYYINIKKSCHNFKLCNATFETIKKILAFLDSSKTPGLDWLFSIICTNPRNWSGKVCKFDRHEIWWSSLCLVLERIHSVLSVTFSFIWKKKCLYPSNILTPFLKQCYLVLSEKKGLFWETSWRRIHMIST